jgi:WD40 repeat protein
MFFSGPSALDALNRRDIPAIEAGLGPETVAVIGLRDEMKVTSLAFRPDGRQVVLARDKQVNQDVRLGGVTLWDPTTRQETPLSDLRGVSSMAYSPDGKRLVVAGYGVQPSVGPSLIMWERISKDEMKSSTLLPAAGHDMHGITFSPDGSLFAYHEMPWYSGESKIQVWDVSKNQIIASVATGAVPIAPHSLKAGQVGHMFSRDGKKLIIAVTKAWNSPPIWKQWDFFAGKESTTFSQPWATSPVPQAVAFAPGGKRLATMVDSTVYLWDDDTQPRWSTNLVHSRPINGLAFAPDGKSLLTWDHVTAYHAGKPPAVITRWAVATGQKLSETPLPRIPSFIVPAHDGLHWAAGEGGKVYILRLTPPAGRP